MNKLVVIRIIKVLILLGVLVWYGIFLTHKIDLTTADLGRHIENGEVIVHGSNTDRHGVLTTNFYSYTATDQMFINHHWGSGVVFYLVYLWFGFSGLSVLYTLFGVLTVLVFWDVARRASNFWLATAMAIAILPLITTRAEVRPEVFTYFLTGVFFWVLCHWRSNGSDEWRVTSYKLWFQKVIWVLPVLMLLWVNLHIGFVFGFLVLGAFGLEQLIKWLSFRMNVPMQNRDLRHLRNPLNSTKEQLRDPSASFHSAQDDTKKKFLQLIYISLVSLLVGLINPNFIKGLLYPLSIFKNYGYLIVENQSIKFLENINFTNNQHFLLFKVVVIVSVISFIAVAIKNRKKVDVAHLVLVVVTAVMAYLGIRNFPSFALFVLPALAGNLYFLIPKSIHIAYKYMVSFIAMVIVIVSLTMQYQNYLKIQPALGFGLLPFVNSSADFFKANKIKGPIFNDYDIGGYLIFNLYPEKVYVDNRPEAYTNDFFQKEYIPAQENIEKWKELDAKYNFNAIFFSHRDYTPWAQTFLLSKVQNKEWAPVFVDGYNIIFVRRDTQNQDLIKKYEISKDRFGVN